MLVSKPVSDLRELRHETISVDFAVIGGGLAGVCAAVTAARQGLRVTLIQDRPVLGGNASSEVRLWALGATSHMGNNNRWAREGGLVDEILVENLYRNKEGNPLIFDTVLLDVVARESNIRLLLNTAVYEVRKSAPDTIAGVTAFCSQNATRYTVEAPLFCDASGDGIVGFQAGAAFRMGAERADEFGERFAPDEGYGELLGHTIYFYSKDTGKPVKFVAPDYALKDITEIPRFRAVNEREHGCKYWWIEYGGRLDTVHDTEAIKWELWKVVYGVWDHIKNSGEFPDAENMTLEWVGTIPGKRESRRFEGDIMLCQQDVIEQRVHADAVAVGGWSLDLHPSDAVYSEKSPCNQWHSKGAFGIPYRCYYSRNISNLFLAGRIISASHVAFGSTRVMLTSAHGGTAVGMAAAHCQRDALQPRDLTEPNRMSALQTALNRAGQSIPGIPLADDGDLVQSATVSTSSTCVLTELAADGPWLNLTYPVAQLIPLTPRDRPTVEFRVRAKQPSEIRVALRVSDKPENFTPERTLCEQVFSLVEGEQTIAFPITEGVDQNRYGFLTLDGNEAIKVACSEQRVTGLLTVQKKFNHAVSNTGEQVPPEGIGIDRFEFWVPERRPAGHNLAFKLSTPLKAFGIEQLRNGWFRPTTASNAWVATYEDENPRLELNWNAPQTLREIVLHFDADFDNAMETVQWGHPEHVAPFCIRDYVIRDANGKELHRCTDNHQTINRIRFDTPVCTRGLSIELKHPSDRVPAALFGLRVYGGA
ncbi:FAD-dependent oxidoreductase [Pontiella agarivorans]|uniref:FAD-dependent oxidoreductase n=1 Tax=Pontiella agarivorans TaxID=3038953 RepID=A0ABU5MXZ9_9BACT|nr:FAD-dependent oxidoreductase [Pontiella agarivorans]MDZ8119095.1 FAD-dependent oxidoreductase [Pontiella agarivorans]